MVLGSLGCFLVIESREHAAARGAAAWRISRDRHRSQPPAPRRGDGERRCASSTTMRQHLDPSHAAVISGASGVSAATVEEAEFLRGLGMPVRATATAFGHSLEPSFPANLALAAIALSQRRLFAPLEARTRGADGRPTCARCW